MARLVVRCAVVAGVGCVLAMTGFSAFAGALHSAVIPQREHSEEAIHFSYFATLINDSDDTAKNCRIEVDKDLPLRFTFFSTDPTDNSRVGGDNAAVDILPRTAQTYGFTMVFYKQLEVEPRIVYPQFLCDDVPAATRIAGLNSVDFSDFTLENVRWLMVDEVERLSEPVDDRPGSPNTLAELNPEQAALISRLNPTLWSISRGPLNTPLLLRGDDLGTINLKELLADPEKATLRYLAALGPLTNVDSRTTIEIQGVKYATPGRNSIVSFTQIANGVRSDEILSDIQFTEDGTVVWVSSKIARHNDLPELVIDAKEAMQLAQDAVKEKYQLWFLCLAETKRISKNGNIRKLYWYDRRRSKVVIGWEVRFLNTWYGTAGRGAGIHTVAVDGASGETRLRGRPQQRYSQ